MLANESGSLFKELSATVVGVNDVRVILEEAKKTLSLTGRCVNNLFLDPANIKLHRKTTLFLDEVHRFNRAQQVHLT